MKALCFHEHGDVNVLSYDDVPRPELGPGEILVRVRATALNHLDVFVRRGWPGIDLPMPHWGGSDVAGEIAELGQGVNGWEIGQRVVVDPGITTRQDEFVRRGEHSVSPGYIILGEDVRGGHAEFAAVPAGNVMAMPESLAFPEAAAPLLVSLTAWRMLIHRARLRAGESVLVVGAGGGVNSMAIQMSKLVGARVYALTSTDEKMKKARALGADVVLNYCEDQQWSRTIYKLTERRGVDVVVDNVGQATLPSSMRAVARGGRIVIVGNTSGPHAQIDTRYIFGKQISLIGSTMGNHQDFRDVTNLLWSGKLKPVVDRVMDLSEGKRASEVLESGEKFGKIVLTP
ncbi:MAG: zinc-binding dehydrogenase [Anaerolineae bacterium]|jgi:NADPH:quinone reductase-like Zn-dependent oxidoreductase